MPTSFQGSGFELELPDEVINASSYVFIRPDPSAVPASLRINPISTDTIPSDLQSDLESLLHTEAETSEQLTVLQISTNARENWTYGFATLAWQFGETEIRERRIYLYIDDNPIRHFIFTIQALADEFDDAVAYFNEGIRTFNPNELQLFAAPQPPLPDQPESTAAEDQS